MIVQWLFQGTPLQKACFFGWSDNVALLLKYGAKVDSEALELKQLDDYEAFSDKGKSWNPPPGYKKITVHMIYAVKHDGRHKSRLVAGGHLTETPIDSVYSSVVSLRGIRLITFLAELNNLEVWATDIGNAYLESKTKELVHVRPCWTWIRRITREHSCDRKSFVRPKIFRT